MVQPAAEGTASAPAAPPAASAAPTTPTPAQDEAKTQTQPPVPAASSSSPPKPQNVVGKASAAPPAAAAASTDAQSGKAAAVSAAEAGADAATDGEAADRALCAQEEARRLQFALAQQQVQQYQAMTRQLEAQSGIAMTPSSSLARTSEDLQKLRQEQLARLQQNVQRQAAMAAQAVQQRSNDEWLRNKLLLEQEHQRLLRLHEQQLSKGSTVTTATATSIADSLLAQQQQVIRQQQLLREMLQKQQKQQQAQLQLQMQLQKGDHRTDTVTSAAAKPAASTYYSMKKKKMKTAFDTELEALAKVCIRVANARTDCEMRQALDKMTSWLHRCTELMLLQIAQRDYRDSMAHRRPMLVHQDRWPLDLQVKSEYITQKIVQMLGAFLLREKNKAAQQEAAAKAAAAATIATAKAAAATPAVIKSSSTGATKTTNADAAAAPSTMVAASTASSSTANVPPPTPAEASTATITATASTPSAAGSATASTNASPKQPAVAAAATTTTTIAASATAPTTAAPLTQPVRVPVKRDMAVVEREYAEMKAQMQAKQLEINQKAKAKRDAAKVEAAKAVGAISNDATTAAMLAATYKRPLEVQIPGAYKKPRTNSYGMGAPSPTMTTGYRPAATTVPPISPRVAQQFYDLDLTTRTNSESEDKMYLPPKIVSKIMYRALPGANEEDSGSSGVTIKREEVGKNRLVAATPTGNAQQQLDDSSETISISDDAVNFMQECVTEFLQYFTSEARDRSVMQNRRTAKGVGLSISGSNVVESMENLGFTPYARVLAGYNEKVKASQDAAARKKIERKKLMQQQAMQKAAAVSIAANAAKAAAAGRNAVSPHSYGSIGVRSVVPSPLAQPGVATQSRPSGVASTASTVSRVIPATAVTPIRRPAVTPVSVKSAAVTTAQTAKPTSTTTPPVPRAT